MFGEHNHDAPKCYRCAYQSDCIFSELTEEQCGKVDQLTQLMRFSPEQLIWQEGLFRSGCYILCSGTAILFVTTPSGKRRTIEQFGRGDVILSFPMDELSEFAAQMQSTMDIILRFIPRSVWTSLLASYPSIALNTIKKLSDRTVNLWHNMGAFSYLEVRQKLAWIILQMRDSAQLTDQKVTHQSLAEMIGVSREAVNKAIRTMSSDRLLANSQGRIKILDEEGLRKLGGLQLNG